MQEKYHPPENEEMYLVTLPSTKRLKKEKRQFLIFKESKRIFFNKDLLSFSGILCWMVDGVPAIKYDHKSPMFIDTQWAIDEKIDGEISVQLERIQKELLEKKEIWI